PVAHGARRGGRRGRARRRGRAARDEVRGGLGQPGGWERRSGRRKHAVRARNHPGAHQPRIGGTRRLAPGRRPRRLQPRRAQGLGAAGERRADRLHAGQRGPPDTHQRRPGPGLRPSVSAHGEHGGAALHAAPGLPADRDGEEHLPRPAGRSLGVHLERDQGPPGTPARDRPDVLRRHRRPRVRALSDRPAGGLGGQPGEVRHHAAQLARPEGAAV
ncbi:LOW QUALITY PROTEIN: serine/threonine protein kinase, partial [Streptomyces filamentosus NRRL 11379]